MDRWDLHVRVFDPDPVTGAVHWNRVNGQLRAWGREGWELVGFGVAGDRVVCAFKRPLPPGPGAAR